MDSRRTLMIWSRLSAAGRRLSAEAVMSPRSYRVGVGGGGGGQGAEQRCHEGREA